MIDQEKFSKKLASEQEAKSMLRTVVCCGLAIFVTGIVITVLSMFYIWPRESRDAPKALAGSWYNGKQIIPSEELISNSDWSVVFAGESVDELAPKSMKLKNNSVDSVLAQSLSATVYLDQGKERPLTLDYLKVPTEMSADEMYVIEFNCIAYNHMQPIDRSTTRYYVAPLRLTRGEDSAITFALFDPDEQCFHQICIPFRAAENIELRYAFDMEFEEQTYGQVYRLFVEVEKPAEGQKRGKGASGYSGPIVAQAAE